MCHLLEKQCDKGKRKFSVHPSKKKVLLGKMSSYYDKVSSFLKVKGKENESSTKQTRQGKEEHQVTVTLLARIVTKCHMQSISSGKGNG